MSSAIWTGVRFPSPPPFNNPRLTILKRMVFYLFIDDLLQKDIYNRNNYSLTNKPYDQSDKKLPN